MTTDLLELRISSIFDREFELKKEFIRVTGNNSLLSLALTLTQSKSKAFNVLPHAVVVPGSADALRLQELIGFFDPQRKCFVIPQFDVSPFSGLDPQPKVVAERLGFLSQVHFPNPGAIFIGAVPAWMQLTLPYQELARRLKRVTKDAELPEDLHSYFQGLGYQSVPIVEDVGHYSVRGGIVDFFSPLEPSPVRLELFGDTVESLRFFSTVDQRSLEEIQVAHISPAKEALFNENYLEKSVQRLTANWAGRDVDLQEKEDVIRSLSRHQRFPACDFLLPYFYEKLDRPSAHFSEPVRAWTFDPMGCQQAADLFLEELKSEKVAAKSHLVFPEISDFTQSITNKDWPEGSTHIQVSAIDIEDLSEGFAWEKVPYKTNSVTEFASALSPLNVGTDVWCKTLSSKIKDWRNQGYVIILTIRNKSQIDRTRILLEKADLRLQVIKDDLSSFSDEIERARQRQDVVLCLPFHSPESVKLSEEELIFLREEDLYGKKTRSRESASQEFQKSAKSLAFGDLKPGDCVVHVKHGIGLYEGLRVMNISGADSEFIQIAYKDKDKLYLPVYRVGQLSKYSGHGSTAILDKLGGPGWEKTKAKVKSHLRDIANDLLSIYAQRAQLHRPPTVWNANDLTGFEASFPYDETEDQMRAIDDLKKDFSGTKPMDRLICGDVGFGKTEVAMRAAFMAVSSGKQVAVLAPTTVLTFQHLETFRKRFTGWPVEIQALNRFISPTNSRRILSDVKSGKVNILIGTHRILSKDVDFNKLGLLIIDEEQKFGVAHKEKIKKMKVGVDTISLSATPIPRTLNMSLVGIRDLSLINTAPVDRLPTRTFICKFDPELIRKSIASEISRGGQVYFIHNRVQSIYGLADEVRQIIPEARIGVAHGQMEEHELEKTMIRFFNHEIDVLICTAIVESGMDVPRANTMFIDQAHLLGLSQLYQLRGRVGRSKQRAYCYLILPRDRQLDKDAQERLKVIQENTALGSGLRIAQYDLELRGAGNLLGEEQAGHINSVGYELYMDLLNETVAELQGKPVDSQELDPEINLRIPAMIPETYIKDTRIRLSYYKALSEIRNQEDLERIEEDLRDQFGAIPEPTLNLLGLMLIRSQCKELGVRDISAGPKNISLIFTEKTKIKPEEAIKLALRENKKYSITPDSRLNVRMNTITWPAVFEELNYLLKYSV
jgi:transcription-repair coupling factor (superfamily II helicase)